MLKRVINIAAVSGAYIATLIGAGFASGQEIVRYFIRYGAVSIFGVALVSVLFGLSAYGVIERARRDEIDDFKGYLNVIMPGWLAGVTESLIFILMMAVFCVMAAGCGASLSQFFGIDAVVGVGALCIFCFICLLFDIKAILAVNGVLAPIIVFGIIFTCIYILKFREISVFSGDFSRIADNWAVSGVSYASYNVLTAAVVLVGMRRSIADEKGAEWVGVVSAGVFFVIMTLLWAVLKIYYGKIELGEIPMLTLVMRQGRALGAFYTVILMLAMVTTAVSNGFGITEQLMKRTGLGRSISAAAVCSGVFLGAGIGFETLVGKGYNLCGCIGVVLVFAILKDFFKNNEKQSNLKINKEKRRKCRCILK